MRKSTFSAEGPLRSISNSAPAADAGGEEGSTNGSAGSTSTDQISRKALRASRFLSTTWTGAAGAGKRSDSWNVRHIPFASPVVSHSPKTEAKPRE